MNVLFLCCAYSETQLSFFREKSKEGFQFAAQNFQEALIKGFLCNSGVDLEVLSIPSLSTFPKANSLITIPDSVFTYEGGSMGKSFGYINLPILNNLHQNRIDKYIDNWYVNANDEKVILVYALLRQQMQYAVAAKKRHPDIKLSIVIPDLPMYMACNKYYKMLRLQKRDMKIIDQLVHEFDSYVVLAEPMVEQLHIADKPYIVIEGIYSKGKELKVERKQPDLKTILYAGGIQTRYGVFDLIEAFHRIKNDEFRLILCGPCLEMDKLNEYLCQDKRIQYLGLLPTCDVRSLQKQVTLLVNPRHSNEEFTRYSFPSKTLEYMASGTPVLMSPLPSMPIEYKEHLFLFKEESVDGMRIKIEEVCSFSNVTLTSIGKNAENFIKNNKSSERQTKKIIELISK